MAPHRCDNPNFDTDFHRSIWLWPPKNGFYGFRASFRKNAWNQRNRHIQELAGQPGVQIFKNSWKTDLNLSTYTVFHAENGFGVQIGPKPTQDPIKTNFGENRFFMPNEIWAWNLQKFGISGRPLGDPKLHSKNSVLHGFRPILIGLR